MDILDVVILSAIEGVTEFLPVSSTGHLILASKLLGIDQDNFLNSFQISIQLGAIFAVIFLFWRKFLNISLLLKLFIAFLPTGFFGLVFYSHIKGLFSPSTVVVMLISVGILFILLELLLKNRTSTINNLESIGYVRAFFIGCFQCFAMIPGTSRSGATIFGGLLLNLDRKLAAEFSFLLAVPTMIVAVMYDSYKNFSSFSVDSIMLILFGMFLSFLFAIVSMKVLLKFISHFSYISFGVYRIIVGLAFLIFVL